MSSPTSARDALTRSVMIELGRASGLGILISHTIAERVGLNVTDLEALEILFRQGPITAGRLAELTGLTTGAITGLVDRLERKGYARREPDPADRRRVIVHLVTDDISRDILPLYAGLQAASLAVLTEFSDEDLALILRFLRAAAAVAEDHVAKLRSDVAAAASDDSDGAASRRTGGISGAGHVPTTRRRSARSSRSQYVRSSSDQMS